MAFEKTLMFGKSQENIGSTDAHACINTAGDVYVRTKNRYVCIFKGGRLNVDGSSEIFSVDSVDSIKKTGIYLVSEVNEAGEPIQSAYLCIDGVKLLLASGSEQYVSFSAVQNLSAENFLQAAKNMGLYFDTLEAAKASGLQNGLVYILSEQRLYKVNNGEFSEYTQTTNAATGGESGDPEDEEGSEDEPTEEGPDSLQIGDIFIDGSERIINAEGDLVFQVNGQDYFRLRGNIIYPLKSMEIPKDKSIYIQNSEKGVSGFTLWYEDGEAYLDVDHLTTRDPSDTYVPQLFSVEVGTKVKNLIGSAVWDTAPTDIKLGLLYPNTFKAGDKVLTFSSTGNRVNITTDYIKDEIGSAIGTEIVAEPQGELTTDTTIDVIFIAESDSPKKTVVRITIKAESGLGYAQVSDTLPEPDSIEYVSGDTDLYYVNSAGFISGQKGLPAPLIGTVKSVSPFVVTFPTQASTSTTVLNNLLYTPIYKIVASSGNETVLWQENENLTLFECAAAGSDVTKKVLSKLGDLTDVETPTGGTFEKYGIYSDYLCAVKAHLYAGTFEGNSEEWYPKYGTGLPIPSKDGSDSGAYDLVVPPIQWIKLIIEKKIDEALEKVKEWIDDAKDELRAYTDSKVSQMESSILSEVDARIAAAIAALGTS